MAATTHVEFETPTGTAYGLYEEFPHKGGDPVACLVIQPENGDAPTRVLFDSKEADKLRKRFPELAKVKAPSKSKATADDEEAAEAPAAAAPARRPAKKAKKKAAKKAPAEVAE